MPKKKSGYDATQDGRLMTNKKYPQVGQLVKIGWVDSPDTLGIVVSSFRPVKQVVFIKIAQTKKKELLLFQDTAEICQIMEFGPVLNHEDFRAFFEKRVYITDEA